MASAPKYKIFDAAGSYQASTKTIDAAAALAAHFGPSATIRIGHAKNLTVWTETDQKMPPPFVIGHAEGAENRIHRRTYSQIHTQ